jgi:hypothetical protein
MASVLAPIIALAGLRLRAVPGKDRCVDHPPRVSSGPSRRYPGPERLGFEVCSGGSLAARPTPGPLADLLLEPAAHR